MVTANSQLLSLAGNKGQAGLIELLTYVNQDSQWNNPRHLAYFLATVEHETAGTFKPIEEYGRGAGKPYGATGFWGRGYIQLTHETNYRKAGQKLGRADAFVKSPDLVREPATAYVIAARGMREGWFTGKALGHYLGTDYINARRVVNGTDQAQKIANRARLYEAALTGNATAEAEKKTLLPAMTGWGLKEGLVISFVIIAVVMTAKR